MTDFNRADYDRLHALVFQADYPGYRPETLEAPNGDGRVDAQKRYAHVATKYLERDPNPARATELNAFLLKAHALAIAAAYDLGAPRPELGACALRVLEYPPGVGGAPHYDFDVFTLNLWRSEPNAGLGLAEPVHMGEIGELLGLGPARLHHIDPSPEPQQSLVYFVLPRHDLPLSLTVGSWLEKRYARSRVSK